MVSFEARVVGFILMTEPSKLVEKAIGEAKRYGSVKEWAVASVGVSAISV